ncbi:putative methylenetetrahydrofolate reductase [Acorus gramineus]|uniref:Methylenetetrahydrofolate reductase n=1 Tax=Acorus gramineus TaxID=55184 RepID=A0AAV9B461_ACOGR|nr:putative methylenetetrahydrofolate reductase [Acorus gramineus]
MRPRSRGKKLQEEWAIPVNSIEDVQEIPSKEAITWSAWLTMITFIQTSSWHLRTSKRLKEDKK